MWVFNMETIENTQDSLQSGHGELAAFAPLFPVAANFGLGIFSTRNCCNGSIHIYLLFFCVNLCKKKIRRY